MPAIHARFRLCRVADFLLYQVLQFAGHVRKFSPSFFPRRPRSRLRRGIFGPAAQSQSLAFPLTGPQHRRISALTSGLELRPELPADEYQKIPGGPPGTRTPIYVPHVTLYFQRGANRSFNTGVRAVPARQA